MDGPAGADDEITPHVVEEQGQHARVDAAARHRPGVLDVVEAPGEGLGDAQVLGGQEGQLAVRAGIDHQVGSGQAGQLAEDEVRARPPTRDRRIWPRRS